MTACGNLQLCARLEAGIEVGTDAVGKRRLDRVRMQRSEEDKADYLAEEEEERGGVEAQLKKLRIETVGTGKEAAEGLAASLVIEVEEDRGGEGEGEEVGAQTQGALGALEFLTQDAEPSRITIVDACNGFNKLSRLEILWTVQHRWPSGVMFTFNCNMHWAKLLLSQPWKPPVTILSR